MAQRQAELNLAKAAWDELEAGSRIEEKDAAKAAWEKAVQAYEDLKAGSRRRRLSLPKRPSPPQKPI